MTNAHFIIFKTNFLPIYENKIIICVYMHLQQYYNTLFYLEKKHTII